MPNKDYPKLRECPFCGGEARVVETDVHTFKAVCTKCPCSVGRHCYSVKEEAVIAWNRRADNGKAD